MSIENEGFEQLSDVDKLLKLEELRKGNLETELKKLELENARKIDSYNEDYHKAMQEFHNLSVDEQIKLYKPRSATALPANEIFDRTVYYMKPIINHGKLQGSKPAVLIYAGQPVPKEHIEYIEEMERKYVKLNEVMRKNSDDQFHHITGQKQETWKQRKPQNSVTITPIEVDTDQAVQMV